MKKLLFFVGLLLIGCLCFAQEQKEVFGHGLGTTPELATENALADAIRKAVGALVDEETVVENDELIEEKIIAFSNGIVQKYDIVKEPRVNKQGLVEITIKATVRSNLLQQKLVEAQIVKGTVDNGEEVWRNAMAQIVTEAKKKEDVEAVLTKLFDSFKPENYVNITLFDKDGNVGADAKLDIVPLPETGKARISIGAVLEIDRERYFKEVFPYVKQTLEYCCDKKTESIWIDPEVHGPYKIYIEDGKWKTEEPNDYKEKIKRMKDIVPKGIKNLYFNTDIMDGHRELYKQIMENGRNYTRIVLQDNKRLNLQKQSYIFYFIQGKYRFPQYSADLVINIYDSDGEIITQQKQNIPPDSIPFQMWTPIIRKMSDDEYLIASGWLSHPKEFEYTFAYSIVQTISFEIPLDDVKDFDHFDLIYKKHGNLLP